MIEVRAKRCCGAAVARKAPAIATRRFVPGPVLRLAGLLGALVLVAAPTADATAATESETGVPGIPVIEDIAALDPIELRREVSRAEGRISDLRKQRRAELAGIRAAEAAARAAAQQAAAAAGAAPETQASGTPEAQALLLEGDASRHREIHTRYRRSLAAAVARLQRLLERQAVIDPESPDQQRLRNAGDPDTAEHWPVSE